MIIIKKFKIIAKLIKKNVKIFKMMVIFLINYNF